MFIIYFILASIITTICNYFIEVGIITENISMIINNIFSFLKHLSKFFIIMAMVAIGLNTNIKKLIFSGAKPLTLGFCCWLAISLVSIGLQKILGIAWFFLVLSPILTTLLTAMPQPVRSQFTFPAVFSFAVFFLYSEIRTFCFKDNWKQVRRLTGAVVLVLGIVIGWKQSVTVGQLWETAHEVSLGDRALAQRIYDRICIAADMEHMEDCRVVFVGSRAAEVPKNVVRGDVIGYSFFQWDASSPSALNYRVYGYYRSLGLPMHFPEEGEIQGLYEEAAEAAKDHTSWPTADSVFKLRDGVVIVKLSDPE